MVKYTIAMVQSMVSANTTVPIDKIHEHLKFSTLWHLQSQIVDGLCKVGNVKFSLDSQASYI